MMSRSKKDMFINVPTLPSAICFDSPTSTGIVTYGSGHGPFSGLRSASTGQQRSGSSWRRLEIPSLFSQARQSSLGSRAVLGSRAKDLALRRKPSLGAIVGRVLCSGGCVPKKIKPGSGDGSLSPEFGWKNCDSVMDANSPTTRDAKQKDGVDLARAEALLAELSACLADCRPTNVVHVQPASEKTEPSASEKLGCLIELPMKKQQEIDGLRVVSQVTTPPRAPLVSDTLQPEAEPEAEDTPSDCAPKVCKPHIPPLLIPPHSKSSRGPGKPPGPPPMPRRLGATQSESGGVDADALPSWQGPQPPEGWKSERVVNWQPIRDTSRWKGSVWQEIYQGAQERGHTPLPDSEWKDAFMQKQGNMRQSDRSLSVQGRLSARSHRALSGTGAFQLDLRHAQLVKLSFGSMDSLRWIFGSSAANAQELAAMTLPEDALDSLLGLLKAADGCAVSLLELGGKAPSSPSGGSPKSPDKVPASERLVQRMLQAVGARNSNANQQLSALVVQVDDLLRMERFQSEAASLERQLRVCVDSAQNVVSSVALPKLLEGVLMLGNFVNASSRHLGGAVGVTLESLAKLAHTKCLPAKAGGTEECQGSPEQNALALLSRQLQETHGVEFVSTLAAELISCREACDLDPKALAMLVQELQQWVDGMSQRAEALVSSASPSAPAFAPARIDSFLSAAHKRLAALRRLLQEVEQYEETLRRHFAEPPTSKLSGMLSSLVALLDSLSVPSSGTAAASSPGCMTPRTPRVDARAARRADPSCSATSEVKRSAPPALPQRPRAAARRSRSATVSIPAL